MDIQFSDDPRFDTETSRVYFGAKVDGIRVRNSVSEDVLDELCEEVIADPIESFRRHRETIYEIVRRRIASGDRDEQGGVHIPVTHSR